MAKRKTQKAGKRGLRHIAAALPPLEPLTTESMTGMSSRDKLIGVKFISPDALSLSFADGYFAALPIARLEMPDDRIRWRTVEVSPSGNAMTVRGAGLGLIPIGAGTLRYLVDKDYAAEMDASLRNVQFSRAELEQMFNDNPPAPEWFSQPARDS